MITIKSGKELLAENHAHDFEKEHKEKMSVVAIARSKQDDGYCENWNGDEDVCQCLECQVDRAGV